MVFSWGALVGWVAVRGEPEFVMLALYAGSIFWVIGYDTIYALQDREDDVLIGVHSSALRLGSNVRGGVALFYTLALFGWGAALWLIRPQPIVLLALLPAALHLGWQLATLRANDGADALAKFRANRFTGLLVALACLVVGQSG